MLHSRQHPGRSPLHPLQCYHTLPVTCVQNCTYTVCSNSVEVWPSFYKVIAWTPALIFNVMTNKNQYPICCLNCVIYLQCPFSDLLTYTPRPLCSSIVLRTLQFLQYDLAPLVFPQCIISYLLGLNSNSHFSTHFTNTSISTCIMHDFNTNISCYITFIWSR